MSSCFSLGGTDSWIKGHFYNKIMGKRETEIYRQVETLKEKQRLMTISRRTLPKRLSKMFIKVSGFHDH